MKLSNCSFIFCAILYCICAANISGQEKVDGKTVDGQPTPLTSSVNALVAEEKDADSVNPYKNKTSERYRIGFQDTLEVQVYKHPELSQTVNVGTDGTIILPKIDKPVIAACKTERELGDLITAYYTNYLKKPFVNVRAIEQRSQPFAVVGAVEKPGNFYLNRRVHLLELIAFAGGPDVQTAGSKIQVARLGNVTGCADTGDTTSTDEDNVQFYGYDLNDVLKGKINPWMQPGDIVSVLISEEAYVVGNVIKPTKVTLNEPKTLMQAIAIAGGLNSTANTQKVIIQRQEPGTNTKSELSFDLKDIRNKKISDPILQANDVVQVSTDTKKNITKGIVQVFKNGLPSIFYKIP